MTIRDHLISKKNAEARLVDQAKADGGPGSGPHPNSGGLPTEVANHLTKIAVKSNDPVDHHFAAKAHQAAANHLRAGKMDQHEYKQAEFHLRMASSHRGV